MISKSRLKELAAYRQQKQCEAEGVFVVEGVKMAGEALTSGVRIRTVCATEAWLSAHEVRDPEIEVCEVGAAALERLSGLKSPNEVWMLAERSFMAGLPAAGQASSGVVLALDRLQDPGNMGTLLRTADWFGVRHVVCSPDTVSCFNPKVVQASMGSLFRTRVDYVDLPQWLGACGKPVYGASLGGRPLPQVERTDGGKVLLIGNESKGISPQAAGGVTHPVLVPNVGGTAESLNASVAAGILMAWLTIGKE